MVPLKKECETDLMATPEAEGVSVIIPTWNRAGVVERAVACALEQTHPALEVLVCDDDSTDDTRVRIEALNDERVRWVKGSHSGGPSAPRNRGVLQSQGEWLAFLDSDDEWLPHKLEKQIAAAQQTGCPVVCTNAYRLVPGAGGREPLLRRIKPRVSFDDFLQRNVVVVSSVLMHRSLWDYGGGFPEEDAVWTVGDYALWLRLATRTRFAYLEEPLTVYLDDAAASMRRDDRRGFWAQQCAVLANFIRWSNAPERRAALAALRRRALRRYFYARSRKAAYGLESRLRGARQ